MSDLFGNHIVGFPTRWLNFLADANVDAGVTAIVFFVLSYRRAKKTDLHHIIPFYYFMIALPFRENLNY